MAERTEILVVDDDRAVTRILRSMLEVEGYGVTEINDTDGLVESIRASPPDLVLLDFHMPQASGLEILGRLGEEGRGSASGEGRLVPVIMLTGESNATAVAIEALKLGALDYLVKPVAMDRLHASVRAALRLVDARRERLRLGREVAAAEGLLDAVLARSGAALVVVDADDRVVKASEAAAAKLGQPLAELIGRPLAALVAIDSQRLAAARAREPGSSPAGKAEDDDVALQPWVDARGGRGLVIVLGSRYEPRVGP